MKKLLIFLSRQLIKTQKTQMHIFCYDEIGRYNEAIECYKQAIRINPDDAEAHYNFGITYLIVGNKGSALEEYKIL